MRSHGKEVLGIFPTAKSCFYLSSKSLSVFCFLSFCCCCCFPGLILMLVQLLDTPQIAYLHPVGPRGGQAVGVRVGMCVVVRAAKGVARAGR